MSDSSRSESSPVAADQRGGDIPSLHELVASRLSEAFPDPVAVGGEIAIAQVTADRIVLRLRSLEADSAPIRVTAHGADLDRIRRRAAPDPLEVVMATGRRVAVRGRLGYSAEGGELEIRAADLDLEAMAAMRESWRASERRRLIGEGVYGRQAALRPASAPLRIGIVGQHGSETEGQIRRGLDASPFELTTAVHPLPPSAAPDQVAAMLTAAASASDLMILLPYPEGGAARALYDSSAIVRAIAATPVPVITVVEPTGDRTLADEVAHLACPEPQRAVEFVLAGLGTAAARLDRTSKELEAAMAAARAGLRRSRTRRLQRRAALLAVLVAGVGVTYAARPRLLPFAVLIGGTILLAAAWRWRREEILRPPLRVRSFRAAGFEETIEQVEQIQQLLGRAVDPRDLARVWGAAQQLLGPWRRRLGRPGKPAEMARRLGQPR